MQTFLLEIKGMTCNHCVMRVKKALEDCAGVEFAEVNLASASAKVIGEGIDLGELISSAERSGYTVRDITNFS